MQGTRVLLRPSRQDTLVSQISDRADLGESQILNLAAMVVQDAIQNPATCCHKMQAARADDLKYAARRLVRA